MTRDGLADYFELQLTFAERMAARADLPLERAVVLYTNFHKRFGLGDAQVVPPSDDWARYITGLLPCETPRSRVDWTLDYYAARAVETAPADPTVFGCFRCEAPNGEDVMRFHFSNRENDPASGPLSRAKTPRRIAELRALFAFVREAYPTVRAVQGASWLYNLKAYRRLFPRAYGASRALPESPVRLSGSSSWGQVLDHRGAVKLEVRRQVLDNLDRLDIAAPWRVFPLPALRTFAPIEAFYRFYAGDIAV